ncbi:MAG: HDOD domain-containing protein [Desulfobacteraceae bacterium]|nr:MAG: HDOD domain-containing protein [Desulfobacteraceae bacterium]
MENRELKKKLSAIKQLPALPRVVSHVLQLLQNPDSTAHEIGAAISQDQALASKVLRTANSAFYGFPRKITTINYAIVVLGLNNIKNIVLSSTIINGFSTSSSDGIFDRRAFWEHSLACGIFARKLSVHLGMKNSEEVFMWGLLHDFGKVVLDIYFHEEFIQAVELSRTEQTPLSTAEFEVFGFNHSGVGALLLRKWSMPLPLVKAVEYHHQPDQDHSAFRIASIVHAADYLCRRLAIGSGGDGTLPALNKKAWKLMGISADEVKQLSKEVLEEFALATEFLNEVEKAE